MSHARIPTLCILLLAASLPQAQAQDAALQPGEAFVTRFAGTAGANGRAVINPNGTVGSIIDLRMPRRPPQGQHWVDEPQRNPVTAAEVGQVFGVALDEGPNVFVAATAAFGLHRTPDNAQWMPGMWGPGGPGGVYVLDRNRGYRPRVLAQVGLSGRPNSGAALGNIAYDKWHKQLFVSDLETGMIHRLRAADGADGGYYDHGTQGRANFLDAENKQPRSMTPIAFDPNSGARIADCQGKFDLTPECWNVAASGRRVWGLGMRREQGSGEVRLYYAVWSSPALGNAAWNQAAEDDKRNSVWSVRLGPDGNFDPSGVRREFLLPDFFVKQEDIARAGYSQPVSDIAFPECGGRAAMLVAERGGLRNLGLEADNPFAYPHEARTLRYELYQDGVWRPVGRYDVGFYNRQKDGEPFLRANCAGGAAFGLGYTDAWIASRSQPDQFVWISGDSLCSPDGPCNLPPPAPSAATPPTAPGQPAPTLASDQGAQGDDSEVHGLQGLREAAFDQLAPPAAFRPYPNDGSEPYPPAGPSLAYLIDTDINVDAAGNLIPDELTRNDATKIGDVAIYQVCAGPVAAAALPPPPPAPPEGLLWIEEGHIPELSHGWFYSHGREWSHYRWASHWPVMSHQRIQSWHDPRRTLIHDLRPSRVHNLFISVVHDVRPSWVHDRRRTVVHDEIRSRLHDPRRSQVHDLWRSVEHDRRLSVGGHPREQSHHNLLSQIGHVPVGSHLVALSLRNHVPFGSHATALSRRGHVPAGSHDPARSRQIVTTPSITHLTALSRRGHVPAGSHNAIASRGTVHSAAASKAQTTIPTIQHTTAASRATAHTKAASRRTGHSAAASRGTGHSATASRATVHSAAASRGPTHSAVASRGAVHSAVASRGPVHSTALSRARVHQPAASRGSKGGGTTTITRTPPKIVPQPRVQPPKKCPPGQRC